MIKRNAEKEWLGDFVMQLDTIRSQLDAAVKLAEYIDLSSGSSFKKAKKKAPDTWYDEEM